METIVVLNPGSASHKYALYRGAECLLYAHYERTEHGFARTLNNGEPEAIAGHIFENARHDMMERIRAHEVSFNAYAVRVVAPGHYFTEHRVVDDIFTEALRSIAPYDPAHTQPVLDLLETVRKESPDIPIVAVSDSAFHTTLPESARHIPLPDSLLAQYDIARFGYHGIALSSLAEEYSKFSRVIVCHLGSGSSITALKDGKSIETSMGYSPLEGVLMSSRSGSVDPAVVALLAQHNEPRDVITLMYQQSGFMAVGGTDDMRVLLQHEAHDQRSALAIDMFVRRIAQYVGAYTAMLGGLDALIFSGTIGERSAPIRRKVSAFLAPLRVVIDEDANSNAHPPAEIGNKDSGVRVLVRHADETREAARIAAHTLVSS